jgi:hypothetical protein
VQVFGLEMAFLFIPVLLVLLTGRLKLRLSTLSIVVFAVLLLIHVAVQYDNNFVAVNSTECPLDQKNAPILLGFFAFMFLLAHMSDKNKRLVAETTVKTKKA